MFEALKNFFIGNKKPKYERDKLNNVVDDSDFQQISPEKETKNDSEENGSNTEKLTQHTKRIEENIIFPSIREGYATPEDPDVKDLKKTLYEKSQNSDGELFRENGRLYYKKELSSITLYWIITDTQVEQKRDIQETLDKFVGLDKFPDKNYRDTKYKRRDLSWHAEARLLKTNPPSILEGGEEILDLELKISWWGEAIGKDGYELVKELESIKIDPIKCPLNGCFDLYNYQGKYRGHAICFAVFDDKSTYFKHRFTNRYKTSTDPFTQKTSFEWYAIGSPSEKLLNIMKEYGQVTTDTAQRTCIQLNRDLSFYPSNFDGVDYIIFEFWYRDLKIKTQDRITFLFETGETIDFELNSELFTVTPKQIKGIKVPISRGELITLSQHNLDTIRVHQKSINYHFDIDIGDQIEEWDFTRANKQYVIINLFKDHLKNVAEAVEDYKPLDEGGSIENQMVESKTCHVYLMKDVANGFYKIGISNEPAYREHTLQSEKPTIELIESKEFPSRKIADSFEKALHDAFDSKRLRGEWFELDEGEVEDIKKSLS